MVVEVVTALPVILVRKLCVYCYEPRLSLVLIATLASGSGNVFVADDS
jgi:hypothetical protein